ncbi:MAG: DEAD/DEAH box helicase, partial [Bacteroidota bacterium]
AKIEGQRFFERFLVEGLTTADQERLELAWNSRYNGFVPTNYFKVPMAFRVSSTFKNEPLFIRPAQREGVGFIAANGKGCLAFGTGVGKTVSAILTIAHKLESGRCRRPLIVVPNGVYGQWMAELQGKYVDEQLVQTGLLPHVPINDFYNLRGDYGTQVMDAEGHVDPVPVGTITLLTYEGFNQLTLSARERKAYQYEFFDVLNQGTESYREEEMLQAKAEALVGRGLEGGSFPIDKLGFDCIVFDEAHNIKKVFTRVRGEVNEEGRRMARDFKIESGSPSMIALRAFMLFYYVLQQNDNRNIVLLTATPFTNSPLEYFSFLALMAFEELKAAKMANLRAFFEQFVNTSLELTVDHTLKAVRKETIMGMSNVRGLQNWIFRFILHKTELDGEANRPKKYVLPLLQQEVDGQLIDLPKSDQINTSLQPSAVQQAILEKLELYARGLINLEDLALDKERMKDLGIDVPDDEDGDEVAEEDMDEEDKDTARTLRAITLSNLVTLSPYLYPGFEAPEPTAKEFVHASPKISYAMQCIASVLNFCSLHDVRVPGQIIYMNAGKKYFPLLREYLIDYIGLGQHEVATISGGNSKKKQSVQDRFLAGKVKVLIGTSAIVEGMNLQTWTTDIYNLWIGWNPAEMHQLTGRGWRPGNRYAHFRHTIPMLENSLDSFKWQKNQEKTSRINQIWRTDEDSNVMSLEDLNPAELKLALITDPFAMAELLLLEEKETIMDSVASLKNQIEVIRELEAAQQEFDRHYDTI